MKSIKRTHLIGPTVTAVIMLVLTILAHSAGDAEESWYFPAGIVLSVLLFFYQIPHFPKKKEGKNPLWVKIPSILIAAVTPFLAFILVESYNKGFWHVGARLSTLTAEPPYSMIILNLLFYYLFYLFLGFLTGSIKAGWCTATACYMAIAIVNYYVVKFRGSPLQPWDLLSARTAGNVAFNYDYVIYWDMLFSTFGFVFLLLTAAKISLRVKKKLVRFPLAAVSLAALILLTGSIQNQSVKEFWGMDTTLFTPNVRYTKNGFVAAYLGNLHLINIEKPEGYSVSAVEEIDTEIQENSGTTSAMGLSESATADNAAVKANYDASKAPNIIVIMDEAFSDLSVLGDFTTNEDYMPFFHSMMEKYTGGHLMVSVKGGNTANTEYEFLSGDSMAFLPEGSVVFQQYIHSEIPTLPAYLRTLGYSTLGMHPYLGSGWDRKRVYPLMGFDRFLDVNSFGGAKYIRKYVSDESAFDKIIEEFEKGQETDSPQFIFEVTMQNHSGYSPNAQTDNGFETSITIDGLNSNSIQSQSAERYLSLIKESDKAFEKLISYFEKNVTEPTIIVAFGDHEPSDYVTQVIEQLVGYDIDASVEERQKSYQVPFFIWNNFGMPKDENLTLTSVNYLSSYLLQHAGLPLTDFQEYLVNLRQVLPVICTGTYIDKDGTYHSWSDRDGDETYRDVLNQYNMLTYNHLTDADNRVESIFLGGS